jgi:kynureninase
MSTDPLLSWRAEFPILDRTVYMISHSLGAMPRRTRDRLKQYADEWDTRGIRAWEEGWWEMPITIGDLVGRIIGAGPGEVVMQQNVSICQAIVSGCFDWTAKRDTIVTEDMNFPSNLYIYQQCGARLVTTPVDRLLAAIDDRTALVSVSHVLFRDSYIQDLAAITRRAHEVGAMIIADLYQSAGTVPVNVRELGVDFATGGSVKWLCGGPGAGYLYVRRDLWGKLQPRLTGWAAHAQPFAFSTEHDYATGMHQPCMRRSQAMKSSTRSASKIFERNRSVKPPVSSNWPKKRASPSIPRKIQPTAEARCLSTFPMLMK